MVLYQEITHVLLWIIIEPSFSCKNQFLRLLTGKATLFLAIVPASITTRSRSFWNQEGSFLVHQYQHILKQNKTIYRIIRGQISPHMTSLIPGGHLSSTQWLLQLWEITSIEVVKFWSGSDHTKTLAFVFFCDPHFSPRFKQRQVLDVLPLSHTGGWGSDSDCIYAPGLLYGCCWGSEFRYLCKLKHGFNCSIFMHIN